VRLEVFTVVKIQVEFWGVILCSDLKMGVTLSSESLVSYCNTTLLHNPEEPHISTAEISVCMKRQLSKLAVTNPASI
jgi:hypothetical protein